MPIHDWKRVDAGIFHALHNAWITHLQDALNDGILPKSYYALGEQRSGDFGPDVVTLQVDAAPFAASGAALEAEDASGGVLTLVESPPRTSLLAEAERDASFYVARRRTLTVRRVTDDRLVAILEIVSPGNKRSTVAINAFVEKAMAAFHEGVHLVLVDLFPPGRHDPAGMHALIWEYLSGELYQPPPDRPLTLASYCASSPIRAYIEPLAVGRPLVDMPLFLTPESYVNVPLEATYQRAYHGVPERWKRVLEAT
jgi:hypothetical protein